MTRKFNLVILALVALFVGAQAQKANVTYTARNGQGKILLTSNITNMDTTKVGIRIVSISNNSSMAPVIQGMTDSILNNTQRSFIDTVGVSVSYPVALYVSEIVITKDTSGVIDTAISALKFVPVIVTPPFAKPTMVLQNPVMGTTTATINVGVNPHNDTTYMLIKVSYGSLNYQFPYPAYKDTFLITVGSVNQLVNRTITLNLNMSSYDFSYTIYIWNSKGDSLSKVYSGTTNTNPTPAMVSSPAYVVAGSDSVSFSDQTVTNGILTRHVAYIANTASGVPFDSIVVNHLGQATAVVTKSKFTNLPSNSTFYVWSCVRDTMFKINNCANRAMIQTLSKPTTFTLSSDSNTYYSGYTQRAYFTVVVGTNHTGFASVLMSKFNDQNNLIVIGSLKAFANGINSYYFDFTNLTIGQKYSYTIYGYDTAYTGSHSPWEIKDTFTFNKMDARIDSVYNLSSTLSKVSFDTKVGMYGDAATITGYISKYANGPALDSSSIYAQAQNGVYNTTFNFSADSSTNYYVRASVNTNGIMHYTPWRPIRTLTPYTPPFVQSKPTSVKVDSLYSDGANTEYMHITIIVQTGKTFDLYLEAALDPDVNFTGSFIKRSIATVTSGVHYYTVPIGGLYDRQLIHWTLYGNNIDSSLYMARKDMKGSFIFHKAATGIDLKDVKKLSIYPNPAKDWINVPSTGSYVLTNAIGQILETGSLTDNSPLNVEKLEAGYYFIRTETGTYKFLKN